MKPRACFFKKINKIDKPLARLIILKKKGTKYTIKKKLRGESTTSITEIQSFANTINSFTPTNWTI